ncbi:hypothetical protein LTR10_016905 [Elasticomyces elasticus]|uniref:AB hydrolase-1 domain-containing protein n=1 Tax=Exophiala sideris TaxID=1016849 RepID=A0ABR0JJT6_9EURO|nr:hypothetical protein LTR10_016905 [Elasticomyces elasticus]KAK5035326.1 hypothetical protein LTS07_002762 [Exophiala sideris]KAK5039323.1 hypothetical protein LTR13_003580 [Exophiala sideris]KAK5066250.1 hypothetical protein LTR69_002768 [Exophiala sideris]KAK5186927.1 hypothetical protein LTR44_000933 [Eurotiomycetes sp. CCFEE 6388]
MVQELASQGSKPSIVIVPGSFSPAYFYSDIVDKLRRDGFDAIVEELPSASRSPPEKAATMQDDAAVFRDVVEKLADQGKDVVFVTHSYGGMVGTEASKGISKKERKEAGKEGGLVKLVYLTSVVATPGKSIGELMGSSLPTFFEVDGDFMKHVHFDDAARLTFSDLPHEKGVELAKKMTYHSTPSFQDKLTYPGYRYLPVSWIFAEDDLILTPEFQRSCIEMIEKESGNKVDIHNIKSGHCPNSSAPDVVAAAIIAAVKQA